MVYAFNRQLLAGAVVCLLILLALVSPVVTLDPEEVVALQAALSTWPQLSNYGWTNDPTNSCDEGFEGMECDDDNHVSRLYESKQVHGKAPKPNFR